MPFAAGDEPTAAELNDIGPRFAYKTGSETVNGSAAIQNDDELFLTVAASTNYSFELVMIYNSGVTPDIKIGFTLPTGATCVYQVGHWAGSAWVHTTGQTVPTTGLAMEGFAGVDLHAHWVGSIATSTTAGTMQVVWAQNTSNASNTTVFAGSFLRLQKMN